MRIAIDGRAIGRSGIGRYTEMLLRGLERLDPAHEFKVLVRDPSAWRPRSERFETVVADLPAYRAGEQTRLPLLLWRLRPDVVHFVNPSVPVLYRGTRVTTIHDLTLIDHRNVRDRPWVYALRRRVFAAVMRRATRSTRVIAPTEFVRGQLIERYGLDPARVAAIHEAAGLLPAGNAEPPVQPPYLLHVGNLFPYKNVERLIAALAQLGEQRPQLRLVLAGGDQHWRARTAEQARAAGVEGRVELLGEIRDEELSALYRDAELLVFPSLSEGFGLPPLEAMAHSTAVAAARSSSIPEVCGDAAAYFDPFDPRAIAATIAGLLDDPAERAALVERGRERVRRFSWDELARRTLAVYEEAASAGTAIR